METGAENGESLIKDWTVFYGMRPSLIASKHIDTVHRFVIMSLSNEQPERRNERTLGRRMRESDTQQSYDLVCVGFGTTALSVASSLADTKPQARILFVERESQFRWNPEHILPDAPIGTNFLRDLATTQNPRAEFTFVNFLQKTGQLLRFTNNSRMVPTRRLMAQYFTWAADRVKQRGWIRYGQEAVKIHPCKISPLNRVTQWTIDLRDSTNGALSTVQTKRIVLATGAEPHIMAPLATPQLEPLVLHSSACTGLLERLHGLQQVLNIAIVGDDQEAVELFSHLHTTRGKHAVSLFYAGSTLQPDNHTADISDLIDRPSSTTESVPPEVRHKLRSSSAIHTTWSKVNLHTLESLYEAQYTQKMHESDSSKWRFQLKPLSEVVAAKREGDRVRLVTRNNGTGEVITTATAFDVIISATGYEHSSYMKLLQPVAPLLDAGALTVDRAYKVNFRRDTLASGCGMWLLGSLEDLKERADSFAPLAERARRAVRSVLSCLEEKTDMRYSEVAVL